MTLVYFRTRLRYLIIFIVAARMRILTDSDVYNLRADPNPVIQRALRVLAESSAKNVPEEGRKIIIYKPTYT